jgi:hypothetical protein
MSFKILKISSLFAEQSTLYSTKVSQKSNFGRLSKVEQLK